MTLDELTLTILPPIGAILVERFNFLDLKHFQVDAARILEDESWPSQLVPLDADREVIQDLIAQSAAGASEMNILAPTFISIITSGFGILGNFDNSEFFLSVYIMGFIAAVLYTMKALRATTSYSLSARAQDIPIMWKVRRLKGTEIIAYVIYGVNILLIALAVIVFLLPFFDSLIPLLFSHLKLYAGELFRVCTSQM